jgi:putative flippase GtrA
VTAAAGRGVRIFSRSAITSLFTTALDFLTLAGLVEGLHANYVLATWAGTVVGSISNFLINKHWAFEVGPGHLGPQALRFLIVQAGASALHTLGVWIFTRFAGLPYLASKTVVAVIVYLGWNYPLNRLFVFRQAPSATTGSEAGPT